MWRFSTLSPGKPTVGALISTLGAGISTLVSVTDADTTEFGRLLAEESVRALLQALVDVGGEAAPSELDEPAGLASSTRSKWLARLRDARLIGGPKGRVQLTPEGWAAAGRLPALPGVQLELAEAIDRWPTAAHRAFLRLSIAAIVSRHHLGEAVAQGHPGFVTTGRTGSGKTALARFVCDVFGVDQATAIVGLPDRTSGEILGRREQSEAGWRFEGSPLLELPFVVFDEFDKAERELQRDALLCFQGDSTIVKEGTRLALRAVPMLTCNKARGRLPVPDEYRRRAIVLDTDPLLELLADLDLELRALSLAGGPPRLDLAQLQPPALRLPDETFRTARELLRRFLTPAGETLASLQAVELLVLGYAPLIGDQALEAATVAVAQDYLTCAATVGETEDGWQGPFLAAAREILDAGAGAGANIEAALARASTEQRAIEAARGDRKVKRAREQDDLTARRAGLVTELRLAERDLDARRLPREHKVAGAASRATLKKLREEAGHARAADALADVSERASVRLAEARDLVSTIGRARESAERERLDSERGRRARAEAARAAKAVERQELAETRGRARELERLYRRTRTEPGERPVDALRELGVIVYQPPSASERGARREGVTGALAAIGRSILYPEPMGWWYAPRKPELGFAGGTRSVARELELWGDATRQVLAVELGALYARERSLEQRLGLAARKTRLRLSSAQHGRQGPSERRASGVRG